MEYIEGLQRFYGDDFTCVRAGSGPQALAVLGDRSFDVIFLDMCFDRVVEAQLLGDLERIADQHNGDRLAARRFLERVQGNYILAALREHGHCTPVLFSHDFSAEPKRWRRIQERFNPVEFLMDSAGPKEVVAKFRAMVDAQ